MGLDGVIEEVLRRGEERRKEIVSLGEKESDDQVRAAESRVADERLKSERRTQAAVAQMDQMEVSSAELESKKALLAAQRQVMEELKEQVLSELGSYPADKRKRLYAKLVAAATRELGECRVYSNRGDRALVQLPSGMTYGGSVDCRGGLVFESKDDSVRLDYRFESMLDDLWNAKMREIHARLFG